jgi:hypothetical protein
MDEITLDEETVSKLMKLTKKELIEKFVLAAVEASVATQRANDISASLSKAETYVEQARSIIESIMERWYHYD